MRGPRTDRAGHPRQQSHAWNAAPDEISTVSPAVASGVAVAGSAVLLGVGDAVGGSGVAVGGSGVSLGVGVAAGSVAVGVAVGGGVGVHVGVAAGGVAVGVAVGGGVGVHVGVAAGRVAVGVAVAAVVGASTLIQVAVKLLPVDTTIASAT